MRIRISLLLIIPMSLILGSGWVNASSVTWLQANESGFGTPDNKAVLALAPFDEQLFAGTYNENGGQLWRKSANGDWSSVTLNGFLNTDNVYIGHLIQFKDQFYAGTRNAVAGGQVWRSSNGLSWSQVNLPGFDPTNGEIVQFAVFKDQIFASTWSFTNAHGAEIWSSSTGNSGDWVQRVGNGFNGDTNNEKFVSFEEYNGYLYVGTDNIVTGAEVWYSNNGTNWSQVNMDGFGDTYNWSVTLEFFNGYLYAGTYNYLSSDNPGAELWRCLVCNGTDWQQVPIAKGFGDTENRAIRSMIAFNGALYAMTHNNTSGVEVWQSTDGTSWTRINTHRFGDGDYKSTHWDNSVTVFNHSLYVGTWNTIDGGEVWQYLQNSVNLPFVIRND